jgi:hypothetical protein
MMRKVITVPILMILVFSLSVHHDRMAYAKEPYWEEHEIALSGLSDEQLQILESTILRLSSLEPAELKMNKGVYRRLTRFNELFGFSFRGKELAQWLLTRIRKVSYHNTWTAAVNQNQGTFVVGDIFFTKISMVERLYLLIHEARHSDKEGHDHVTCPKTFKFVSAAQPDLDLEHESSCDAGRDGAYAFQSAFLFELYAYGLIDQKEAGLLYNSSVSRVSPGR